ncbi:hypothetical protein THAOC_12875, partial [Thalassiosira oceanica]
ASGKTTWEPTSTSTPTATPCFRAEISGFEPPDTPQIQQVYVAMNPLLVYTLALMHLPAFHIPRASGKTTWEPTSTSTPTATPCFRAEISGFEPPDTPQIQQVYVAMNPLLVYTLALMHLPAFYIPRASGKTTWEPVSTSTPTATPCFRADGRTGCSSLIFPSEALEGGERLTMAILAVSADSNKSQQCLVGSEPPPQDRIVLFMAVMPSPPVASGGRRKAELSLLQSRLST